MKVVALITAFNEEDVIGQVVGDLIAQGLEVYLMDHASTDGTVAEVERFAGRGLIAVERFAGEGFDLRHQLARKEQLAQTLDADWFLHCDADELRESPWPGRDLRSAVSLVDELGYNAVDFECFTFPPTRDGFDKHQSLREFFPWCEVGLAHEQTRVNLWKRQPSVELRFSAGHMVRFPGQRLFPIRFIMRHYPVRSQAHGSQKIFRERRARYSDEERRMEWHVQYDHIHEGHSFLRDPATLLRYDVEAARFHETATAGLRRLMGV
jgi:glycosyltransferase involved in cell wall biosynthesis